MQQLTEIINIVISKDYENVAEGTKYKLNYKFVYLYNLNRKK
jgi:hypothetical protein